MEARLESLERGLEAWRREVEEDRRHREVQESRRELQEARLKKIEDLLESLARSAVGGSVGGGTTHVSGSEEGGNGLTRGAPMENSEDRWRKLEIPLFSGDDAYGWVNRMERYFQLKGVSDEERLQAVMVAMEGRALSWFQWWESCSSNPSWDGFRTAVIRRFQPSMMRNPYELLLGLKQTASAEEFRERCKND